MPSTPGVLMAAGKPYEVAGLVYTPREDPAYDRVGSASWYGELFHGRRTANGEIYDMDRITAAHPTLPLPSIVRVTNLANRRQLELRVNDRGPFHSSRVIDVSYTAALKLGLLANGRRLAKYTHLGTLCVYTGCSIYKKRNTREPQRP